MYTLSEDVVPPVGPHLVLGNIGEDIKCLPLEEAFKFPDPLAMQVDRTNDKKGGARNIAPFVAPFSLR